MPVKSLEKINFSFFNRIFNINKDEWKRVWVAWFTRFLYRFGFVIGWTMITAMFVTRFGISSLPYLFVVNAFFIMLGSFLYVGLLKHFRRSDLIISTIISAALLLLGLAVSNSQSSFLIFTILLFVESLLLVQLNLLFEGFIERLFTSLESERTFPFIESADTLGGIIASIIVLSLAGVISTVQFIYIWLIALVLIIPIILLSRSFSLAFKICVRRQNSQDFLDISDRLSLAIKYVKKTPFLKALVIIVFLHWFFANLIEFQYTSFVYENVRESVNSIGGGFEHSLVHDLGALSALFYMSALVVQLFLGSRLITSLGIIGSIMVYPIIMILSILGMFLHFNFIMAILAKNNFVISGTIYKNAYLSSYYVIQDNLRPYVRELFEGFVHTVGALAGVIALLILQHFLILRDVQQVLSVLMLLVVLTMLIFLYRMQRSYTRLAIADLLDAKTERQKISAIKILAQRGHNNATPILISVLMDGKSELKVRLAILKLLKKRVNEEMLNDLIALVKNTDKQIRCASLDVIAAFISKNSDIEQNIFANYRLIDTLHVAFKKERDVDVKIKILQVLSQNKNFDSALLLLNILKKSKNTKLIAAAIALGRNFEDSNLVHYIDKFVSHKDPFVRAEAIVTIWRFPEYRRGMSHIITYKMMGSKLVKNRLAMLKALFDLGDDLQNFSDSLLKLLKDPDKAVAFHAALALARIGDKHSLNILVDVLENGCSTAVQKIHNKFDDLHFKIRSALKGFIHRRVSSLLVKLEEDTNSKKGAVTASTIDELNGLLAFVASERETTNINELLEENYKRQYAT